MQHFKTIFQESGLLLLISYIAGFFAWNLYLAHFGFFEYDLTQTRFLSAGFLILLFPVFILGVSKRLSAFFFRINFLTQALLFFFWTLIFSVCIFPYVPQYFGGARPQLASVISNSEITESFNLMGISNSNQVDKSIETIRGCKIYENKDQVLFGFTPNISIATSTSYVQFVTEGTRVLEINRNNIEALSMLPQNQRGEGIDIEAYTALCKTIRTQYGADVIGFLRGF